MPEAHRGAARQSLHSVLYSSPAWPPEHAKPNASLTAVPLRQEIHPRFAQATGAQRRPDSPGEAMECVLGVHRSETRAFSARKITKITLRLVCWLSARSPSPPAAK